jgi:hypothetical protein
MRTFEPNRRGQVIVMVTLVLIAMCGVLGLAVDLGWAYFVKKSAQAAVDAAALAAANNAFEIVGQDGTYDGMDRQPSPTRCSLIGSGSNLYPGCFYAQQNGFRDGGRQSVWLAADANSVPPTVPKVGVMQYWVTATAAEGIPQLFSAVLGNKWLASSARATAAVIEVDAPGSLYTLDRQNDIGNPRGGIGNDIYVQGNGRISAGGDIYLSSTRSGTPAYAGMAGGTGTVESLNGGIYIRGGGTVDSPGNFIPTPENGYRDGSSYKDPMRGKGQPPPPRGLPSCAVPDGDLAAYCAGGTCGPGNYYAIDTRGRVTGGSLTVGNGIRLGAGGFCANGVASAGGFGNYVFFGGVTFPRATMFDPGRYVFAGVKQNGSNPGDLVDVQTQTNLQDNTPLVGGQSGPNRDAGEIFVFTDTRYPGLEIPAALQSVASALKFGMTDFHAGGAGGQTEINLHGLNPDNPVVPRELKPFAPVVFWQDQANSTIKYTPKGYIDCGQNPESSAACAPGYSLDNPKTTGITNGSPEMVLQATPSTHLYGTVYQARGAWAVLQGGGRMIAPLQLITGSISVQGGPDVVLQPTGATIKRQVVALIE